MLLFYIMDFKKLSTIVPTSVFIPLVETCTKFQINTELRVAHFLAQIAHESDNFKYSVENLNYSADRLLQIFPKYFPDKTLAEQYARKPILIASKTYANRLGNGNEASQEGYKFRGRGYVQITGKDNYVKFGTFINEDIVANPDLVATPKYAMLSAGWFFFVNKIHLVADKGATEQVIREVTKKVNGGYNGIDDRIKRFNYYNNIITAEKPMVL